MNGQRRWRHAYCAPVFAARALALMPFLDLLPKQRINTRLEVSDKPTLIAELAAMLATSGEDANAIRAALMAREELGSTGLGRGVAIPHGRSATLDQPRAAFARLARPIEFGSLDARPVDLVAALLVPSHFTDQHLQLLAELAEMFSDAGLTDDLRNAPDACVLRAKLAEFTAKRS